MKLLADENIPRLCVEQLRQAGHDVAYVADIGAGAVDPVVLHQAGTEARILITEDRDFGTLVYALFQLPPVGVVYLRLGTASPEVIAEALLAVIENPDLALEHHFTVVEPGRTRQRPLPGA